MRACSATSAVQRSSFSRLGTWSFGGKSTRDKLAGFADLSIRYFRPIVNAASTLRVVSVITAFLGALLLLGTWDGLYEKLSLPQALPALGPQIGGIALLALAYLLWYAASTLELRRPVVLAGSLFYLGSAALIASWLIFRDKVDLGVDDTGWVILIISAVVFAALGVVLARWART
jgi:hypothetical protein